ncbi:conjugative transposon protein TraM [Rufibacter sp. LB8]|uniref:conjugative transposon protein TraM n=1 Tax=Rufibacter sp. LB8 TaxID=2777781 RepID=UPI00178C77F2|nr:conjugative transposon protein TraM [Rufibacter sp. LB8]
MKQSHTLPTAGRRNFFLLLPLLVFPFLTLSFWALKSGGNADRTLAQGTLVGLRTELPEAVLKDKNTDKLGLYEQVRRDSPDLPPHPGSSLLAKLGLSLGAPVPDSLEYTLTPATVAPSAEEQEERILRQMEKLNQELNRRAPGTVSGHAAPPLRPSPIPAAGVPRESPIGRVGEAVPTSERREEDPELRQLEGMLEKILDIQHPERVRQRKEASAPRSPLPADLQAIRDSGSAVASGNTIAAIIHMDQKVVSGDLVRLRLLEDVLLDHRTLQKHSFLFGTCEVEGERLKIHVKTILLGNEIIPVSLSAYDLDGQEGLHITGSLAKETWQGGKEEAAQHLSALALDPSPPAQVARAGIQVAKGLFRKKTKSVRIQLKAGLRLLFRLS